MAWREQIRERIAKFLTGHGLGVAAAVSVVPVGRVNDGLTLRPAGTIIDKPWHELFQEFEDAREAWRKNPLARRLIGLITSYTVGNGITLEQ